MSNLEKLLGALGGDRKESGQGDRESYVRLNDQERKEKERGKKIGAMQRQVGCGREHVAQLRFSRSLVITFARRDEVVPGLGDVGEGEVDHGSRVAAARQRCLPQAGHRAVAVASRFSLPSCLPRDKRMDDNALAVATSNASTCARLTVQRSVTSSVQNTTDVRRRRRAE